MPDTGGFFTSHHRDKEKDKEKPEKDPKDQPTKQAPAKTPPGQPQQPGQPPKPDDPGVAASQSGQKPKAGTGLGVGDSAAYHPPTETGGGEAANQPNVEQELAEFQSQHPEEAGKQVRTVDSPVGGLEYPGQQPSGGTKSPAGGKPPAQPTPTDTILPDDAVVSQTSGGLPQPYGAPPTLPGTSATQADAQKQQSAKQQGLKHDPTQASPASRKPGGKQSKAAQDNVIIVQTELPVNGMNFRGVCERCGWQTFQPQEQMAQDGVLQHLAGTHNIT